MTRTVKVLLLLLAVALVLITIGVTVAVSAQPKSNALGRVNLRNAQSHALFAVDDAAKAEIIVQVRARTAARQAPLQN